MTAQPTCAERIADHMAGRAETIGKLQRADDDCVFVFEGRDTADERLQEMPLSVEVVRHVKILLSWGGPSDWLDAELDADNDIVTLVYHFADWFDHAQSYVEKNSALWRFAESFAEAARS